MSSFKEICNGLRIQANYALEKKYPFVGIMPEQLVEVLDKLEDVQNKLITVNDLCIDCDPVENPKCNKCLGA